MKPNKAETAVQWFRISHAGFTGFSVHSNSIYRSLIILHWYAIFAPSTKASTVAELFYILTKYYKTYDSLMYFCIYARVCECVCVCVCLYIYIYVRVWACLRVLYLFSKTHTYMCITDIHIRLCRLETSIKLQNVDNTCVTRKGNKILNSIFLSI